MRQQAHAQLAREDHERVVIGAVPHEVARGWPVLALLFRRQAVAEIERVGDAEAKVLRVERARGVDVLHVEAEVTQPPDAEGAGHAHAADKKVRRLGLVVHDRLTPWVRRGVGARAPRTSFLPVRYLA